MMETSFLREKAGAVVINDKLQAGREAAYAAGRAEFDRLAHDPTFRDFVSVCVSEATLRQRRPVAIRSPDPSVAVLAVHWLRRLSHGRLHLELQFHAGQDIVELVRFWARELDVDAREIKLRRELLGDAASPCLPAARLGVLAVRTHDPYFQLRLQGWMDRLREEWAPAGIAEPVGELRAV